MPKAKHKGKNKMTYPAGVDPNFIIITQAPCEGREKRRQFIRRRVMQNYHAQKDQQRKQAGEKVEENAKRDGLDPDAQSASKAPSSSHQASRRSTRSRGISSTAPAVQATASSFVRPPSSLDLLKPKRFSDARDRHSAGMVMRFICGQVMKSRVDFRGVVFVHGNFQAMQSMAGAEKENALIECRDLLRDYSTPEGRVDFESSELWEKVCEKQESIYTKCLKFSKWKLLSAAQAMAMYVLLRLSYGRNHPAFPDADIAVLFSVGKTFKILQDRYITRQDLHSPPTTTLHDWHEFVFYESIIRTSMIYFILTLVASMEFGIACDQPGDWRVEEIPLPAGKATWDATGKGEWERTSRRKEMETVLTFGDLMRMHNGETRGGNDNVKEKRIQEWLEGVDELGLLVGLAAGLKPPRQL